MGRIAMRKLHHVISGDEDPVAKTVVYGELVIRESA